MQSDPINALMQQGLRENVFPGAVLLVGQGEDRLLLSAYGKADIFANRAMTVETVFDLASLTKPLATALAVALLVERGRIGLDQPAAGWLPVLKNSDKARITIRQLLCHSSGLPAHRLFYMQLKSLAPEERKAAVLHHLASTPLTAEPGTVACYSDLGFMLLCRLVEAVAGRPMNAFLEKELYGPMGLTDLFFMDLAAPKRISKPFAATELCPLRNRLLTGEVHDDNAWFAGGVDGHAGLFGTALAVFQLIRNLVAQLGGYASTPLFSQQTLAEFLCGTASHPLPLGFDRPDGEHSSSGRYFSSRSVGHLGFTGTSFWLDLEKDLCVVLLTNRVHPYRWNTRLRQFRPRIHDRFVEQYEIESRKGPLS